MTAQAGFIEIMHRLRRSVRNGERLHLDHEHVLALIGSPIYSELSRLEAEEMSQEWQSRSGLENFGSLGEQTGANGQSAGTMAPLEPAVESQLVAATTTMILRQSKHNKPSPPISPSTERQKRSKPALREVSQES